MNQLGVMLATDIAALLLITPRLRITNTSRRLRSSSPSRGDRIYTRLRGSRSGNKVHAEHIQVYKAIVARDPEAARAASLTHLIGSTARCVISIGIGKVLNYLFSSTTTDAFIARS